MESDKSQKNKDIPSGKAVKLIEQIQYREGTIVARVIIDNTNGSCRLVALDKEQGRSEHTAPFDALVYLLDGEAEITISGKPLHLKQGEMIVIPANESHALRAITRLKVMSVMIKP